MSQYSETVGSFIRTGNYPLEANYIFESELELKNFYSEDINHTLLHKGLLKIVSSGNLLILYWVTSVDGELQFKPLISANSLEELFNRITELRNSLDQEITNREQAIIDILGTDNKEDFQNELDDLLSISNAVIELLELVSDHSDEIKAIVGTEEENIVQYLLSLDYGNLTEISNLLHQFFDTVGDNEINTLPELKEFLNGFDYTHSLLEHLNDLVSKIYGTPEPNTEFRTLRGIQDFLQELSVNCYHRDRNLQTELDQTQIGVGLNSDGLFSADLETNYLKNATSVMNALKTLDNLISLLKIETNNTNSVNLTLSEGTLSANVKISETEGNQININSDGLYHKGTIDYQNGILTYSVNGQVISTHNLGLDGLVERSYYDATTEKIIIVFKLHNEETLQVEIPVSDLITEWQPLNNSDSVVELTRERVINGIDNLSADVRISSKAGNKLSKDGNSLYVNVPLTDIEYEDGSLKVLTDGVVSKVIPLVDKLLVNPVLNVTWQITNQAGNVVNIIPNVNSNNISLEQGYKVKGTFNFKWTRDANKKDPTSTSGVCGTSLPNSGALSNNVIVEDITSNLTFTLNLYAPKSGFMVSGSNIVAASGNDVTSAKASVSFLKKIYYGASTSSNITSLSNNKLQNTRSITISGVTADPDLYYVYAYPKSLGALTKITQNGAIPILEDFNRTELTIINSAGLSITYYVYTSKNKGAFTNVELKFE